MAKAVSKLAIQVSANTSGVTEGFNRVNKDAKKLRKNMSAGGGVGGRVGGGIGGGVGGGGMMGGMMGAGLGKMLGPIAGIAAVGLAVRKVGREFSAASQRMDDLAKTASKLDLTTEALNGLRNAGTKTGVPVKQLDKGLEKMQKGISELGVGIGESKRSFDEMGLSWEQMAGLAPDEQFKLIAEKMNEVGLQSDKVRHAMAIFGKSGVGLINTFKLGADGIDKYTAEVKELNGMMEGDEQSFEEFNDAVDDMNKAFEGLWNEISVAMIPILLELTQVFKDAAVEASSWIEWLTGRESAEKHTQRLMDALGAKNLQRARQAIKLQQAQIEVDRKKNQQRKKEEDKAHADITRRAQALRESLVTPLEMARKEIKDIRTLFSMGAINAQTSATAIARAQEKLFEATRPPEVEHREKRTFGAVLKGSMREAEAIRQQRSAAFTAKLQRKKMLTEAGRRRRLLEDIKNNTNPANTRLGVAGIGP